MYIFFFFSNRMFNEIDNSLSINIIKRTNEFKKKVNLQWNNNLCKKRKIIEIPL